MAKRKYNFGDRIYKDKAKRKKVESFIRKGIKADKSPTKIYKEMIKNNISYNYQNTLKDIRKIESEYNIKEKKNKKTGEITVKRYIPKTSESRKRKADWYNDVFIVFMEKNNLTPKQAKKQLKEQMRVSLELISEITDDKKYWVIYREVFGL